MKNLVFAGLCLTFLTISAQAVDADSFYHFYTEPPEEAVVTVLPSTLQLNLTEGEEAELTAEVEPADRSLQWKADGACSIVEESGGRCVVRAGRAGSGAVTVTEPESGASATVKVSVKAVQAREVVLNAQSESIAPGEAAVFRAQVLPENADAQIKWSVIGADGCAAVSYGDNLCKIKGLDAGSVTVRATVGDGRVAEAQVEIKRPGFWTDPATPWKLGIRALVWGGGILIALSAALALWQKVRRL